MRTTHVPPAYIAGTSLHTSTEKHAQPLSMRLIALLAMWALILSILPVSAWAADNPATEKTAIAAVEALNASGYKPKPTYGIDTNVNTLVKTKLATLGFSDVAVQVLSSSKPEISASSDPAINGDVTYFYHDPWDGSNYVWFASTNVTFLITSGGTSAEWSSISVVNWDIAQAKDVMQTRIVSQLSASNLMDAGDTTFDDDDDASLSITKNLTLPKTVNGQKWADVTWKSSDPSVLNITDSTVFGAPFTGTITRGSSDSIVTLTATFDFNKAGYSEPKIVITKDFQVTVLGYSAEEVVVRTQELEAILNKCTLASINTVSPKAPINPAAVLSDFTFPATSFYRTAANKALDGKIYKLSYSVSDPASIGVNSFRGSVFQPLPGEAPSSVKLFASLTKDGITAKKEIGTITLPPLTVAELDREVSLMNSAKFAFFDGIKGENVSSDAITKNLTSFTQYRENADSTRTWATTAAAKSGLGIIPTELDGWYNSEQWRLFKSSNPTVVAHETLRVTQPQYDTVVRIDASLTSERFASYASRFPANPYITKLIDQPVSTTVKVLGINGPNPNPKDSVSVTNKVIGLDGGISSVWIPLSDQNFAPGTTAWDASVALFEKYGFSYQNSGGFLDSISKPDGTKLSGEFSGDSYKFWAFYINGEMAQVGASSYFLEEGDSIAWVYLDGNQTDLPAPDVATTPDAPRPSFEAFWPQYGRSAQGALPGAVGAVVESATPVSAKTTALSWKYRFGKIDSADPFSAISNVSDLLIINNELFMASTQGVYNPDWSATYNTSKLEVIDRATGAVKRSANLASPVDSTCRPLYADGLVIVPLLGGRLQALTADTLTCVWITDPIKTSTGAQNKPLSALTYADGHIFMGTTSGWGDSEGILQSVNIATGAISWRTTYPHGFYWAGSALVTNPSNASEKFLVCGGDDATVSLIDPRTGAAKHTLKVSEKIRSSIVAQGSDIYFTTADGRFHKLSISGDSQLVAKGSVALAAGDDEAGSTSTPTIYNGRAYVGGRLGTQGILAVIDLETMTVIDSVEVEGEVKSSPLVAVTGGKVHVYFTANAEPGGVYVYSAEKGTVEQVFVPEDALKNYAFSSVIAGPDGVIYYTNDSGTLFALKATTPAPIVPVTPVDPSPKPTVPAKPKPSPKPAKSTVTKKPSSETKKTASATKIVTTSSDDTSVESTLSATADEPTPIDQTAPDELLRTTAIDSGDSADKAAEKSPLENKLIAAFAALIALSALGAALVLFARNKKSGEEAS